MDEQGVRDEGSVVHKEGSLGNGSSIASGSALVSWQRVLSSANTGIRPLWFGMVRILL